MAKRNRLKKLLTTNLESKLAKGLPRFKRRVEKEIIKHDPDYKTYRAEREEHRQKALQEIAEIRENYKAALEKQLDEIEEIFQTKRNELKEKSPVMTEEEIKEYRELQDKRYTIGNRLEKFLEEDWSQYGVENWVDENESDSETDSIETVVKDEQEGEKTIMDIVAEHLALGEIPSNFKYLPKYQYPYDPKLNTSGKWDLWKEPWFIETFPKHLLEALKESSREYLKKTTREVFEEGYEEEQEDEEHGPSSSVRLFESATEELTSQD